MADIIYMLALTNFPRDILTEIFSWIILDDEFEKTFYSLSLTSNIIRWQILTFLKREKLTYYCTDALTRYAIPLLHNKLDYDFRLVIPFRFYLSEMVEECIIPIIDYLNEMARYYDIVISIYYKRNRFYRMLNDYICEHINYYDTMKCERFDRITYYLTPIDDHPTLELIIKEDIIINNTSEKFVDLFHINDVIQYIYVSFYIDEEGFYVHDNGFCDIDRLTDMICYMINNQYEDTKKGRLVKFFIRKYPHRFSAKFISSIVLSKLLLGNSFSCDITVRLYMGDIKTGDLLDGL